MPQRPKAVPPSPPSNSRTFIAPRGNHVPVSSHPTPVSPPLATANRLSTGAARDAACVSSVFHSACLRGRSTLQQVSATHALLGALHSTVDRHRPAHSSTDGHFWQPNSTPLHTHLQGSVCTCPVTPLRLTRLGLEGHRAALCITAWRPIGPFPSSSRRGSILPHAHRTGYGAGLLQPSSSTGKYILEWVIKAEANCLFSQEFCTSHVSV